MVAISREIRFEREGWLFLLLLMFSSEAGANAHGVTSLEIIPAEEPPIYAFDQIEDEVTTSIRRADRNLQIRVAMLGVGSGASSSGDCDAPDAFAAFELFCDLSVAIANSIESAVERKQSEEAIEQATRAHIASDPALAPNLASAVDQLLASNAMQLRLAGAIAQVVADETDIDIVGVGANPAAEHRLSSRLTAVEAVGSRANPGIAIRLHGQVSLTRVDNETVVATQDYVTQTPEYLIEEWSQGGIQLLSDGFSKALMNLAEVLAEEAFLTVTSPKQRRSGYLLEPTTPLNEVCLKCDFRTLRNYGYFELDTLVPTFEWNAFEDAYAEDPLVPDADASTLEVTYDLRLFRARRMFWDILVAGEQIAEFRGIQATNFSPGFPLDRCAPYLWTVRARFSIDGRTYLTHWSGNFKEKKIEDFRRKRTADSGGAAAARAFTGYTLALDQNEYWREGSYYFPFIPNDSDQHCTADETTLALDQATQDGSDNLD
jgi:hypothetical protein